MAAMIFEVPPHWGGLLDIDLEHSFEQPGPAHGGKLNRFAHRVGAGFKPTATDHDPAPAGGRGARIRILTEVVSLGRDGEAATPTRRPRTWITPPTSMMRPWRASGRFEFL